MFNRAYFITTKKGYLTKDNAEVKQVLTEKGYQESIISKIFRELLTLTGCLSQSQQLTQATDIQEEEIRMSINLPYVEGNSEKLRRMLKSHKIISTFYTESFLRKLFFSIMVFFHGHWRLIGQRWKGGDHFLFFTTTSTH